MQQNALYFVMGVCTFSEVASFVSFVVTKNPEITLLFQIPSVLYMYQILHYLFPTKEGTLHPLLDLLRLFLKR